MKYFVAVIISAQLLAMSIDDKVANYNKAIDELNSKIENQKLLKEVLNLKVFNGRRTIILAVEKTKFSGGFIYQVRTPRGDIYIFDDNEDKNTFIVSGFNAVKKYTENTLEPIYINQDLKTVKEKGNHLLKFGSGKKELIYVTNFECPNCEVLHSQILMDPKVLKNYTFYVIPVHFSQGGQLSPTGKAKTQKILLQKSNDEKLRYFNKYLANRNLNVKTLNRGETSLKNLDAKVLDLERFARKIGAYGTPSIFELNGKPFEPKKLFQEIK